MSTTKTVCDRFMWDLWWFLIQRIIALETFKKKARNHCEPYFKTKTKKLITKTNQIIYVSYEKISDAKIRHFLVSFQIKAPFLSRLVATSAPFSDKKASDVQKLSFLQSGRRVFLFAKGHKRGRLFSGQSGRAERRCWKNAEFGSLGMVTRVRARWIVKAENSPPMSPIPPVA